jgi:endonuclease/exonuclease/phosphatase family metal-dependent hydrolase
MRLVSWNINGLDDRRLDERSEAAMFTLMLGGVPTGELALDLGPPPDVIALQEVVPRALHAHIRPHLGAAGYQLLGSDQPARAYFELIAVRRPWMVRSGFMVPLEQSGMGRHLVGVVLDGPIDDVLVLTGHLESLAPAAPVRVVQLEQIVRLMAAHDGPSVFAGDTNLRDRELAGVEGLGGVHDAWQAAGSEAATRFTWHNSSWRAKARFDRAFVRGLDVIGFALVGTGPSPPSDHLGLDVRLALS